MDLLAPTGPLDRPLLPTHPHHLAAVADWITAGIPQMSPDAVAEAVDLVLTGPGARTVRFGLSGDLVASITCSVDDLVLWSTGRQRWQSLAVSFAGDTDAAARFCDTVHVF